MALPDWIAPLPGRTNAYVVDPDIYYPQVLAELGVEKPTQYWLEVALGCMKLDFDLHVRMSGQVTPGRPIERRIRADDGRKARWNLTMHPAGKPVTAPDLPVPHDAKGNELTRWEDFPLTARARHIRYHYKRIRGFVPSG